jgi:hypothetical protein
MGQARLVVQPRSFFHGNVAPRAASAPGWRENRAPRPALHGAPARDWSAAAANATAGPFAAAGKIPPRAGCRRLPGGQIGQRGRAASRRRARHGPMEQRGAERLEFRPRRDELGTEHDLRHAAKRGGRGKKRFLAPVLPDDVQDRFVVGGIGMMAVRVPVGGRRWTSTFPMVTSSSGLPSLKKRTTARLKSGPPPWFQNPG